MEVLQKERSVELDAVQKLKDDVGILLGQMENVQFTYRDPVKNFDRSKVKGVVAKLIKVKDSYALTALEVTAGGKLYNVVVDTEHIGKELQNGNLRKRVTNIPLTKIKANVLPPRVEQAAARIVGEGNVELAFRLVGYDDEVKNAMAYVFESTFICRSTDAAKEIAFDGETSTSSVTLEGDIFQPSGLLTGGSRRGGGKLLGQLHALVEAESQLGVHQRRLSEIDDKPKKMKKLEQELGEATTGIKEKQLLYENCNSAVSALEKAIKEHMLHCDRRVKELDKRIKTLKSVMQLASKSLKGETYYGKDAVIQELATLGNQLVSPETQINALAEALGKQKSKVSSVKKEYDQAESDLNHSHAKSKECDSQISCIAKARSRNFNRNLVMQVLRGRRWKMSLEKRVNKKVMAMFEKAEDECNDIMVEKNIIENDE